MKKIIIRLKNHGEISVEADGFIGNACLDPVKTISDLLGQTIESKPKPEYFIQQENTHQLLLVKSEDDLID